MIWFGLCALLMGEGLMEEPRWELNGGNAHFSRHRNLDCLVLQSAAAVFKDVQMVNGEIEADFYSAGQRSFGGLIFRVQSSREFELLYLRAHKSGEPDAIQYTPRFNGNNAWQLYHGEGFEGTGLFHPDGWTHVRIRFRGGKLWVYLNGSGEPAFETNRLQRDIQPGGIGLWGGLGAIFTHFSYRELPEGGEPATRAGEVAGALRNWSLSPSFLEKERDPAVYPEDLLKQAASWQKVAALPDGLLQFDRYINRAQGGKSLAIARTTISAERERWVRLGLGYSDDLVLFLNGRLLFSGKAGFRARSPVFLGLVSADHDAVNLPLHKGENELLFVVSEVFGGWGVKTRLETTEGLSF